MADNSAQIAKYEGQIRTAELTISNAQDKLALQSTYIAEHDRELTEAKKTGDENAIADAQLQLRNLLDNMAIQEKIISDAKDKINFANKQIHSLKTDQIDSKPQPPVTPVKSGSGTPSFNSVNAEAVAAGDYAYAKLGHGTAGGMGNAALLSTTTILPNTKRTQVSKAEMEAADKEYTTEMNKLSQHWSVNDTTSPEYEAQKQAAMQSQYKWELARNNLEEVSIEDRAGVSEGIANSEPLEFDQVNLEFDEPDLSGESDELVPADDAPAENLIVVEDRPRDQRVRIRAKSVNEESIYGKDETSILSILRETDGVFFPYTPTIFYNHQANYSQMAPTHANTDYWIYNNTPAVQINIQGQFSSQNLAEARYTLAAMHFFRTVQKMRFGENDPNRGLPPPVLILSGYGNFMFNDLNVIVTEFSMDLPNNVDYLEVDLGDHGVAWVPSLTTFNVSCVVQNTPKQQREDFNFDEFASGNMMRGITGWI